MLSEKIISNSLSQVRLEKPTDGKEKRGGKKKEKDTH